MFSTIAAIGYPISANKNPVYQKRYSYITAAAVICVGIGGTHPFFLLLHRRKQCRHRELMGRRGLHKFRDEVVPSSPHHVSTRGSVSMVRLGEDHQGEIFISLFQ